MEKSPVITESDLQFTKNGKKFRKPIFKDLTAISCPFKALDRLNNAPYESFYNSVQRVHAQGLQE